MATRKKRRRPAGRRQQPKSSPFTWLTVGLLLGLGGAVALYSMGFLPAPPDRREAEPTPAKNIEPELLPDEPETREEDPRYDFFTVLPEMEVVIPERELSDRAQPQVAADNSTQSSNDTEQFVLQAGSFRSSSDADQMKARLALLGSVASVQQVTVNNQTWHRVRLGPVNGARAADELRRQLQSNGIDVLVLKVSS